MAVYAALLQSSGLVADITFLGQVAAIILVFVLSGMSLTLPGIAGLILTVGMSVDANVIIFERIKEELRSGKTVQAAIDWALREHLPLYLTVT